jgi:transglutaminase-like putative cysteine protease
MLRRDFIKSMGAGAIAAVGLRAHAAAQVWREFEITYRINIKDAPAPVRLWVPVPQDALDYQRITDLSWRSPAVTHVLWEGISRAPIVAAAWMEPSTAREMEITARVATRDHSGFFPDASQEELAEYLKPTASSPNTGVVLAKAREIVGARTALLDKARAIYDWIVDNTFRRSETRGCGLGDIAFMLETGDLGGKWAGTNERPIFVA